jgi:hypothetical protein
MSEDITKYLVKLSREEYDERNTADFEVIRSENARENALNAWLEKDSLEEQKNHVRKLATERKRKQRQRERQREISNGIRDKDGLLKQKKRLQKVRLFVS